MQDVSYTKQEVENFKRKVDHKQMFSGNVDSTINVNERYDMAEKLINQLSNVIKSIHS